jgi:hypothetical protein
MYGVTPHTVSSAVLSPCRRFRYSLTRTWDASLPTLGFVGLNPSRADEESDDSTIRKEIGFARRLGCGSIHKVNLFGWRATDPKELRKRCDASMGISSIGSAHLRAHATPAELGIVSHDGGVSNDMAIYAMLETFPRFIIAAWGAFPLIKQTKQDERVESIITTQRRLHALRLTKDGVPEHTLYLPYMQELEDGTEVPRIPIVYREKRT